MEFQKPRDHGKKFLQVGKYLKLFTSTTNVDLNQKSDFLPGGTMSGVWGRLSNLIVPES